MVGAFLTLIALLCGFSFPGIVLLSVAFFSAHSTVLALGQFTGPNAKGQATSFYLLCYYSGGAVMGYLNGVSFLTAGDGMLLLTSCLIVLKGIGLFICRFYFRKI